VRPLLRESRPQVYYKSQPNAKTPRKTQKSTNVKSSTFQGKYMYVLIHISCTELGVTPPNINPGYVLDTRWHRATGTGAPRRCPPISPACTALSSKPAARRCFCRSMEQTDRRTHGRTPGRFIDPATRTMQAAFNCRIVYGHYLPTVIHTIIWYSITHSLFHSRLKTFLFCKSFPLQPFLFLLQDALHGFPRLFTVTS